MTQDETQKKLRQISDEELKQVLEDHIRWRESESGVAFKVGQKGRQADLSYTDLRGRDLKVEGQEKVNLYKARLEGANLIEVHLRQANLFGANLREADLIEADLRQADLERADLHGADLHGADLHGADLSGAILSGAHLIVADLRGANLDQADLCKTRLGLANLFDMELDGTDFSGARVIGTIFGDVDLSQAKGLETIEHSGPSSIGIDTLYKSKGMIPPIFLERAGVPMDHVEYFLDLADLEPIQRYSCFISYSSKDERFVNKLFMDLRKNRVRCWYAPQDMKIGQEINQTLETMIRVYDKVMVILSKNSIHSAWVKKEVDAARERERRTKKRILFPISIDQAVWRTRKAWAADLRRDVHIGDFRDWQNDDKYQSAFDRLLRDLKAEESPEEFSDKKGKKK